MRVTVFPQNGNFLNFCQMFDSAPFRGKREHGGVLLHDFRICPGLSNGPSGERKSLWEEGQDGRHADFDWSTEVEGGDIGIWRAEVTK